LVLILIVVFGLLLVVSQGYLSRHVVLTMENKKESDLYLPEPAYLAFISCGHEGLVADLVLAKALTYFGSHYYERHTFGFKHLKKLFFTAVEMDPMNRDAILLAGNILGNVDMRSAMEILKLGMFYHPQYWKFPEMMGFYYFFKLNNPLKAAQYYEMASRLPGHPPYVPSISGKLYEESGRYGEALRVLINFYTTAEDKRLKESFKQSILELEEKIKKRDFMLKATIIKVLDGVTVEFKRDASNPQFGFLKRVETYRVVGPVSRELKGGDGVEKLAGLLRRDYARFMLEGADVGLLFQRERDGSLKRDSEDRLMGSITMKNNLQFEPLSVDQKLLEPEELDRERIYSMVGKTVSIRFTVQKVEAIGKMIYFRAGSAYRSRFSAVIPVEYAVNFETVEPGSAGWFRGLEGKTIVVNGLAQIRGGEVQVTLYFPGQLKEFN